MVWGKGQAYVSVHVFTYESQIVWELSVQKISPSSLDCHMLLIFLLTRVWIVFPTQDLGLCFSFSFLSGSGTFPSCSSMSYVHYHYGFCLL